MRAKMRGHLSLLVVVASAAAVLVIAPAAAAADTACVGTMIGDFDNVVVQPGQSCVINFSTVSGNVKALEGSRLLFINSTVQGSVQGDKASAVQVVTSTVRGNVEMNETGPAATVPVGFFTCAFGFGLTPCEAYVDKSTVEGSVQIQKTRGTAFVNRSSVGGNVKIEETESTSNAEFVAVNASEVGENVQLSKNKGPGNKGIFGTTVGANLQCFENDLPFFSSGNFASAVQGQCSAAPLP